MSATGSFFSSLLGGYADATRQRHKELRDREDKARADELEVLKQAVNTGRLSQDALEAAFSRMEEITSEGGKKKKGGFSFKNLLGQFQDVGQTPQKSLEQATAERQGGAGARQPAARQAASEQATLTEGERPAAPAPGPPVPTRGRVFRTEQEMNQAEIDRQKAQFEQVTKPEIDYTHQQRLDEIKAQYGGMITRQETKIMGGSVPLPTDANGRPIDPAKSYTVLYDRQGRPVSALEEAPARVTSRLTGPEAKVDSMKRDILAEQGIQPDKATPEQNFAAERQARELVIRQARATLSATIENTRGRQFANRLRAELEKGIMTPATARAVIGYVGTEAKRRFNDDIQTMASGKSLEEIEDDIYRELGTSREQVSGYLRQGAKGPTAGEPGAPKPKPFKRDLAPVPTRP